MLLRVKPAVLASAIALAGLSQQTQAGSAKIASQIVAQRLTALNLADRAKPRLIVTSDVEIDDVASWHRFWLYCNQFDIEGLVYTSSRFHWAGDPAAGIATHDWAGNDVIEQMLKGYGRFGAGGGYSAVYRALQLHDASYPTPEMLLGKIRLGNITNIGEMAKDSPGSLLIKASLLSDKPGKLYLAVWGGTNTIAAALRSIEQQYRSTPEWPGIRAKVVAKARLYIILDQDDTYKNYIAKSWPDLFTVYNRDMFWSVAYEPFRATRTPPSIDRTYFGADFMRQIAQGPMLQTYPLVRPGDRGGDAQRPPMIGSFISEGDSPSYWFLLANGLRSEEDPSFGGWGGRFVKVRQNVWTDRPDALDAPGTPVRDAGPEATTGALAQAAPLTRWIPALQNDFLARSRWTYNRPEASNHEPVVHVPHDQWNRPVRPGQSVTLAAQAVDPDGDGLDVKWWQYREAGTYRGKVSPLPQSAKTIHGAQLLTAQLTVPGDAGHGDTIHVIAEVTDTGTPRLTRYARFVLTVQ